MNTSTLKEYYVKLQLLYNNAVNILTGINQSLSSNSSEITVTVADSDDVQTLIRIPSFMYLESKIEQLENNFSNLFDMPKSGEGWFSNSNDMYKLKMVQSNIAPISPIINNDNISAYVHHNNFLKDLINPKTYLKLDINNIPDNIEKVLMKKIVILDDNVYAQLLTRRNLLNSYQDYTAALSNLTEGVEYEEYDSIIETPIKRSEFDSEFKIIELPHLDSGNPYYSENTHNGSHLIYQVRLDTLKYYDSEDKAIEYQLKKGDKLTLEDNFTIYNVLNISKYKDSMSESIVTLEEIAGHTALQDIYANSKMILKLYQSDYNKYHYVELPLEENEHIVVFLSLIYDNVRSEFSAPLLLDLNMINMHNQDGSLMKDPKTGKNISYISYYNQFCTNVGDIIEGISNIIYPQFSNINNSFLDELENGDNIKKLVNDSIDETNIDIICINNHLFNSEDADKIKELYAEKNNYNSNLTDIQSNIDSTYNLLINTDFSTDLTVSQESLKQKLNDYFAQRTNLTQEYINIVNQIATLKETNDINTDYKYRIRGFITTDVIENYIKGISPKCDIIGIDIEYKYVGVSETNSNLMQINHNTFTNWNKYKSIDKERVLDFDSDQTYEVKYVEYSTSDDIIKWNQLDIPITKGEDVVLRIRFKYNVGQPFINFYSPWSDNVTFKFPEELNNISDLYAIVMENDTDLINSRFLTTLINEGYQEHITNKIIDNSRVFYHMPENIYSGFNTPENSLISLKDKLLSMSNDIEKYSGLVNNLYNQNYQVYLEYDNNMIELHNSSENIIYLNNNGTEQTNTFTKKYMNIIIKNMGDNAVNLYSIFHGNTSIPLLNVNDMYTNNIEAYQRVPILVQNDNNVNNIHAQTLGQFIYFRQNNPYTLKDLYYNSSKQRESDIQIMLNNIKTNDKNQTKYQFVDGLSEYMRKSNSQLLLPYKTKLIGNYLSGVNNTASMRGCGLSGSDDIDAYTLTDYNQYLLDNNNLNYDTFIHYNINQTDNKYLLKYEHFTNGIDYLDNTVNISDFVNALNPQESTPILSVEQLQGLFVYPEIPSSTYLECNIYEKTNRQYKSIQAGTSITIPVVAEYYLISDQNTISSLSQTICFDICPYIDSELDHYIIKIVVNNNIIVHDNTQIQSDDGYTDTKSY